MNAFKAGDRLRNEHQSPAHGCRIERGGRQIEQLAIRHGELYVVEGERPRLFLCKSHHAGDQVGGEDSTRRPLALRGGNRRFAGAASDIQHMMACLDASLVEQRSRNAAKRL